MDAVIPIKMMNQPDDTTCGPTSLHAVYDYYKDYLPLEQVIKEVTSLQDGGTLAVMLASHALKRGYATKIYTYNLKMFDPTWLLDKRTHLIDKLNLQLKVRDIQFSNITIIKFCRMEIQFLSKIVPFSKPGLWIQT